LRSPHGLRRQFDQASRIEYGRIRGCRRIEHRPGDQRLEEVAVDIEVLEDDLLEENLEVEPWFVAVDVRIGVEGQDRAMFACLNSTDPFDLF
jgi:hypothetical protein